MAFIAELYRSDSVGYARAMDSVLRAHSIDTMQLRRTSDWYAHHVEELAPLFETMISHVEKKTSEMHRLDSMLQSDKKSDTARKVHSPTSLRSKL